MGDRSSERNLNRMPSPKLSSCIVGMEMNDDSDGEVVVSN